MIDIGFGTADGADLLVVPVLADRVLATESDLVPDLDSLSAFLDVKDFSGKKGQNLFVATPGGVTNEALLVGLGSEVDLESIRRAAGSTARSISKYGTVATLLHDVGLDGAAGAVLIGSQLGLYEFNEYRSEPKTHNLQSLVLVGDGDPANLAESAAVARGVVLARDLTNRPAADKSPEALAEIASSLHEAVVVTVFDEHEIAEKGFGGLAGVNAGADRPARMVVMEYRPDGATATVAFVGKGIVFDSGGLSIKPAAGMEPMKTDMAGAAVVMAAVRAIAEAGLRVNVIGITPLTENLSGGSALKPGDVVRIYNGKTMEILNTDAEGRIVLADGLSLATEMGADLIVDIATLTGTAKAALGTDIGALFTTNEDAGERVLAAAQSAGEKFWELPLDTDYRSLFESDIADMKNTGGRWGGAIIAALILAEFVDDTPWVHLDVAGPARAEKTEHYITKGASGFGVRTLFSVAASFED